MKTLLIAERFNFHKDYRPARGWTLKLALRFGARGKGPYDKLGLVFNDACNLLPPAKICGAWDKEEARTTAEIWQSDLGKWDVVMLAGRRVAEAFSFGDVPFLENRDKFYIMPPTTWWTPANMEAAKLLARRLGELADELKVTGLREAWE